MSVRLSPRILLWPLSLVYGLAVGIRNRLFDTGGLTSVSFDIHIISVGNITAGGTGKTPHVEYLAARLSAGKRVAVLSRGYGRKSGGFLLIGGKTTARKGGDEPVQIKNKFPDLKVAVDNDRVHGIRKLLKLKKPPEIILLDDAFQHRYVRPGMSILLVSYQRPVFSDMLLPAGNLREPATNASRADIVIVTKCPQQMPDITMAKFRDRLKIKNNTPVYFTTYEYGEPVFLFLRKEKGPSDFTLAEIKNQKAGILLVTGIADPKPLERYLSEHVEVDEKLTWGDHHAFNEADVKRITEKFKNIGKEKKYIILTEKDAMRIKDLKIKDKKVSKAMCYIPVEVKFLAEGEEPFLRQIENFLKYPPEGLSL